MTWLAMGTTTATVLAQAMITEGFKSVASGVNPLDLKKGMDEAVAYMVNNIKESTTDVEGNYQVIKQIATISANNDENIGSLIANAVKDVTEDGVITVEQAKGLETYVDVVEGMQFDRGYLSPYFVNDSDKMEVKFENPYILLTDKKISAMKDLLPILEQVAQSGRPLVIVADSVDGEALSTLVINSMRGSLQVCAIQAPSFGDNRGDLMNDLATLTGGVVASEDKGYGLDGVSLSMLGECDKVIVNKSNTTIVNGHGETKTIEERIETIKSQIKNEKSKVELTNLKERLAKLSGGVAVIYVGAPTETEMIEKKDRVDDALSATKAALEEGIVPGGGVALLRASEVAKDMEYQTEHSVGASIVIKSIRMPLTHILRNAGVDAPEVIINTILGGEGDFGYNAKTEQFEDLMKTGVIDPTKVVRVSLENAVSVAGMLLTTECVINELKEDE